MAPWRWRLPGTQLMTGMFMQIVWGLVIGISVLHYALLGYAGDYPSHEAQALMSWAFALMLAHWCLADAKRRRYHRPYEFGAFLFFLWPLVLPAYLLHTRGWRGLLPCASMFLLACLPWLSGVAAYAFS